MSVFAQVAVDVKSSHGNVTIMQKKNISDASKFGKLLSHTLLNFPLALGKVSECAYLFS